LDRILSPAAAQPKGAVPRPSTIGAATDRARELHIEGARLFEQGKYDQAYVAFVAAWALKKHPQIAGNLADCEAKIGKYTDAAEHYAFVLRDPNHEADLEAKRLAQERLTAVRAKIGTLTLAVSPAGAEVMLDGKPLGTAPFLDPVFVDPGPHTLDARKEGLAPGNETIDVKAGAAPTVTLALHETPLERRSIVPGAVLGGVAGAALVTAIGLTVVAFNKRATVQDLNKQIAPLGSCVPGAGNFSALCATLQSTTTTGDTLGRAGVGLFVVAGAAALASTLYFVWPASKPGTISGGIGVAPVASTTGGAMVFSGAF
jgi:hypothetical protein